MAAPTYGPQAGNPRAASRGDDTTLATIVAAPSREAFAQGVDPLNEVLSADPLRLAEGAVQIENIAAFSYRYDVLQIGDPFSATIPDPRGLYRDKLLPGWSVQFYLRNPAVRGGAPALKAAGIITDREAVADENGTRITITGADIGWHLVNNDAPLWFNLRSVRAVALDPGVAGPAAVRTNAITLGRLAEAATHPERVLPGETDPGWGFQDPIRASNAANRALKRGLPFSESERLGIVAAAMNGTPVWVQVQPGQKIADLLIQYARRAGLLVGVSVDGHLQFWLPDYDEAPAYTIRYSREARLRDLNNVKHARRTDSLASVYTHVTVVAENPIFAFAPAGGQALAFAPQANKLHGKATPATFPPGIDPPPFRRRITVSDGEIVARPNRRAMWHQLRGLWDAQTVTYRLRRHHQAGQWWEADTMCDVQDDELGLHGPYYASAVECTRDMAGGDQTTVTLRRPGLLTEIPLEAG